MAPVQHASNTGTTSPVTVTLSATGSNNTLVVYVGTEASGGAPPTVSGITLGATPDTFTKAISADAGGFEEPDAEIWTDPGASSGQTSVVVTFTGGSGNEVYTVAVEEWAGVYSTVDKTSPGDNTSSSFSSGSTGTLSKATELAVAMVISGPTAATYTGPSSPWTDQATIAASNGATNTALQSGWQQTSATTALTYSGTINTTNAWAAVIATLELSPNVNVAIAAAVVKVAAQPLSPHTGAAIAAAVVKVAAQPLTPAQGPPIAAAVIRAAAQPLGVQTGVTVAAAVVKVAAQPLTPVITVPQLVVSVTTGTGTDEFGDAYLAGLTAYALNGGTYYATSVVAGAVSYYSAPSAGGPWTLAGTLTIDIFGALISSFADVQLSGTLEVSGLVTCDGDLAVDGTQIAIGGATITATNFNMDPAMGTPPDYPLSGSSTTAQIAACVNAIISEMQNRGMIT